MRVLHLMDSTGPQVTPTTLAMLADAQGRLAGVDQQVLLLGGKQLGKVADAAGVRDPVVQGVPLGRAILGGFAVQRRLAAFGDFDLIHCWSIGAMTLATLLRRDLPRVLTVTVPPDSRAVNWLRVLTDATSARGPTTFLPTSNTIGRALLTGGLAESAVHTLRPGIDMSRVRHGRREALRRQWNVGDDVKVVALLGDPPKATDAHAGTIAVSLAAESCHTDATRDDPSPVQLLIHPDARYRRRAQQAMRGFGRPDRVRLEPRLDEPWEVLPGCDAVLVQGEWAGLSMLWAMAGNVPIVGEATYATSEIVEDHHSALLTLPGQPKMMAHRLRQLIDDRQLAWRLRDTGRHEAYSFFSSQRYRDQLRLVYEQIASGQPVSIPPMESTGGLRFAGRA